MKIRFYAILMLFLTITFTANASEFRGVQAEKLIKGATQVRYADRNPIPEFISFRKGAAVPVEQFTKWAQFNFHLSAQSGFELMNADNDQLGYRHLRYQQIFNGIPVQGTMFILHTKNNLIESMNGFLIKEIKNTSTASLSESQALNQALSYTHADQYRWQIPFWEHQIKSNSNNPNASWFPQGKLFWATSGIANNENDFTLCYRFDIYAEKPLSRKFVFVNANNGVVQLSLDRIHHTDKIATATTAYSGNREITTDSVNTTTYRLRESGRGLGISTFNLQQTTTYANTDFLDADNFWNNVNAQLDEYATDAHFGAESTYDFYFNHFGRNSIDNAGQALISYVHYDVNYVNAFWDGTEMTYGDGNNTYTPLTSLDIAGHEISHGLTENTSNLVYQDESGAMNESFSDCMGIAIRFAGKQPATVDWLVGNEIGGTPFRNMANPNQYNNPDCYGGTYWNAPNEVHNNSGVMNFWFYLLSEGGAGTNDIGNAYSVSGLGIDNASAICYRMNAFYLTPNSTHADARYYAIQAAADLFGPCTPEVIATTNAWYACGVGAAFINGVNSDFSSSVTSYCQAPSDVAFTNLSNNGGSYIWDFGDGNSSTANSPIHTYTNYGLYTVSLIADGGVCGIDTTAKVAYISIDTLNPCIITLPSNGTASTQNACSGYLYDSGGPGGDYTDNTNSTVTISPLGASTVVLTFTAFNMENTYDFLNIYDGPTNASPLIGSYTGTNLPGGGTITSTSGSITLQQTSDQGVTASGFALSWQCQLSNVAPTPNFTASSTNSCTGNIQFTDQSLNGATGWQWDFGDGATSIAQNPLHTYTASGTYDVTLVVSNTIGNNTLVKTAYITIALPQAPTATSTTVCSGTNAILNASGTDSLVWFAAATGGSPLFTGSSFTTPVISSSTTFYVESEIYTAPIHEGPVDNNFGTGSTYTNTAYRDLIFDCFTPVILTSVQVYASGAGNRTITLSNSSGTVLQSTTVNIPDGPSRITLNFNIPAGVNLELGATGGVNLYRNQSGAIFPYNINGLVSITGTNAGTPGYYYFFYDWEIQELPCLSARTAVFVTALPAPLAGFSYAPNVNTLSFTDQSSGATSWSWNFGDGNTSTQQNPINIYSSAGYYTITLIVSNGTCTDTTFQTIGVGNVGLADVQTDFSISIFPVPAKDYLQIQINNVKVGGKTILRLRNMLGQDVLVKEVQINSGNQNYLLNLPELAGGIYTLMFTKGNDTIIRKIELE
ncbi:hypothetical protein BH11BAC2_BH11BAC2_15760 [soil metagenome]